MSAVRLAFDDRVATIAIDRERVLNALDRQAFVELDAALDRIAADDRVRAVVITGSGDRAFAAGADIRALDGLGSEGALEFMTFGQRVFDRIANLPKPTVAAVNGYALGGGLELAMACDIRIAADTAHFGQPEITLGSIPGWGGTQRLPLLVGLGWARDLILTGRLIDATEAERIGLVTRVVPAADMPRAAAELAAHLAGLAPIALALAKDAMRLVEGDLAAGLRREREYVARTFATADQREGTRAFLEKRAPRFTGR
ncbi:MAG: enoyl-CoA hydratase/isomerase family protein [Thermomicrobiales bacterium]|nr:enoyl-CoA hydratase/isomerase family protein [Thermomicrobiales bacterium]